MPRVSKQILGVRLDETNWDDLTDFCYRSLAGHQPLQIVTLNGEFVLLAQKNKEFRETINSANLVIPDSTNVLWAGRRAGLNLPEVTAGSELTLRLCKIASETSKTVYLLGGRGDVPEKAGKKLAKLFPQCKIIGYSNHDFTDPSLPKEIASLHPDIVLVAFGAPKQDIWIAKHKAMLGAKLLVGIGGTLDMLAGQLPRAPYWLRVIHLEWLWRLIIQPSRWRRTWRALVVFPWLVLTQTVTDN